MSIAGTPWLSNYLWDSRALLSSGVLGDFTERDHLRFGLVNLQVGLYPLLHDRQLTNVAAIACGIVLALILLWLVLRTESMTTCYFLAHWPC